MAWPANTAPTGGSWLLCDGSFFDTGKYNKLSKLFPSGKLPDLRDRFLVGVGNDYSMGTIGGEAFHQLTIDEMPRHNHSAKYLMVDWANSGGGGPGHVGDPYPVRYGDLIGYTGGNQPHENRPPYYAVAWYIRAK